MAADVPFYCTKCPFNIVIFFRGKTETMLKNYNGHTKGFCMFCKDRVDVDVTKDIRVCPNCSKTDFLGWNVFDCPKCGAKVEESDGVVHF